MANKNKIQKKENNKLISEVESQLDLLVKGQTNNSNQLKAIRDDLHKGFVWLAFRNGELLKSSQQTNEQLDEVLQELNAIKQARKETWANRKRLPKRDPIIAEIYKELIKEAEGPSYLKVRLRLALCILAVTGIRINELLPLKVKQLQTLVQESWIAIDRFKRGPSNHKAVITKEGKKLIQDRQKDFELIFLMKEPDSYVFTSEANHSKQWRREAITRDTNRVMSSVSRSLPDQPFITSDSFRIGYISKLWKDTKDIEFVKQSVGHRRLDKTSSYVGKLSDQERQERSSEL